MDDICYIGLEVNSRPPHYTVIGINSDRTCLLDLTCSWEDLAESLEPFKNVCIAVNTAITPNVDFLKTSHCKKHKPGKWPDIRRIEYELEECGAPIYHTPKKKRNLLASQGYGFELVNNLKALGFEDIENDGEKTFLEVPAETAFWSIERKPLFEGANFIGRIQRQLLLLEIGLELPDPMNFFEEITQFKLLTGNAPLDMIYELSRLNAWMNAYTALQVKINPSRCAKFGYKQEGFLYLPFPLPDWEDEGQSIQNGLF